MIQMVIDLKPKPTINDYFDLALAQYFAKNNDASRNTALKMIELFPDQIFGYEWAYNNGVAVTTDTTRPQAFRDSLKKAWVGPDALKMYEFAKNDTVKFKKNYISAVRYLGPFYINEMKDKEKSLEFFEKWLVADPANAPAIQDYIDKIKRMKVGPAGASPNGNQMPSKNSGNSQPVKSTSKTTAGKSAVSKT
jgi:hypothetical protein